jgi:folate-binding protein YgfZ
MTETPFFTRLPGRGLITIKGTDRFAFLQGLITNDLSKLSGGAALYACLLTPQGKFLHDFFVLAQDDNYLLDCEGGARAADLAARLQRYKLRAKVEIILEENTNVFAILPPLPDFANAQSFPLPEGRGIKGEGDEYKDPRHPAMGLRSHTKPDLPEQDFAAWDERRLRLCIPDGSRDLIHENSTLDEARMDALNAIDYQKGCYVGQELTARMHYRRLGKKHLYAVMSETALPAPGTEIRHGGSLIGEMRSSGGAIGLALLKDDAANLLPEQNGFKIIGEKA